MTRTKHPFLIALALAALFVASMLAAQGFYHVARADAAVAALDALDAGVPDGIATSPAAAAAPVVHDPATAPAAFAQDVWSLARTGQWALVAVLVLAAAMVVLTKVADKYAITWLVKAKPYLAAASAVLLTQCGSLATGGHVSLSSIGVVAFSVLLALVNLHKLGSGEAAK